ncbi:deacylase, partial [Vibrio fluvialis]|nr:deacylase [Vibrio fluvialis]
MRPVKGPEPVAKVNSKNKPYQFLGESIPPGSKKVIELEAAKLYTHSPLSIPVEIIHGSAPGP